MSAKKPKFYVVWEGVQPGIYTSWEDARLQIATYSNPRHKSFSSLEEAEHAFRAGHAGYRESDFRPARLARLEALGVYMNGLAVDAACSGVPGPMEYRGIWVGTGEQAFHGGPFEDGTSNVGEFLAIVHAAAMLKREGRLEVPIYSDSLNALAWARARTCRTKLKPTPQNTRIFELLQRAVIWLKSNPIENPLQKWETQLWGEIPADFGRK